MFHVYSESTGRWRASFGNARDAHKFAMALGPGETFTLEAAPCACGFSVSRCECDPEELERLLDHEHEEEERGPRCGHGRYIETEGCPECEEAEAFNDRYDQWWNEY